jgi:hypothetical protein
MSEEDRILMILLSAILPYENTKSERSEMLLYFENNCFCNTRKPQFKAFLRSSEFKTEMRKPYMEAI